MRTAAVAENTSELSWRFDCPACRTALSVAPGAARCPSCDTTYRREAGIWRFLSEHRLRHYHQFLREYQTVRAAEGWGRGDAGYYQALPRVALDDPQRAIWRQREG